MKTFAKMVMLSGAVYGLLAGTSLTAHAQFEPGRTYVLHAHLTGETGAEGKVQFRMNGNTKRDFSLQIVDALPGVQMVVVLRRGKEAVKFAWVRADKQGYAELYLSGDKYPIPVLQEKDTIEVWSAVKGMTMHGEMY